MPRTRASLSALLPGLLQSIPVSSFPSGVRKNRTKRTLVKYPNAMPRWPYCTSPLLAVVTFVKSVLSNCK